MSAFQALRRTTSSHAHPRDDLPPIPPPTSTPRVTITITPDGKLSCTDGNLPSYMEDGCMTLDASRFTGSGYLLRPVAEGVWSALTHLDEFEHDIFRLVGDVHDLMLWSPQNLLSDLALVSEAEWVARTELHHQLLFRCVPYSDGAFINVTLRLYMRRPLGRLILVHPGVGAHNHFERPYEYGESRAFTLALYSSDGTVRFAREMTGGKELAFAYVGVDPRYQPTFRRNYVPRIARFGDAWVVETAKYPIEVGLLSDVGTTYQLHARNDVTAPEALVTPWEAIEAEWLAYHLRGGRLVGVSASDALARDAVALCCRQANWVVGRRALRFDNERGGSDDEEASIHVESPRLFEISRGTTRLEVDGVEVAVEAGGLVWVQRTLTIQVAARRKRELDAESPIVAWELELRDDVDPMVTYSLGPLVTGAGRAPVVLRGEDCRLGISSFPATSAEYLTETERRRRGGVVVPSDLGHEESPTETRRSELFRSDGCGFAPALPPPLGTLDTERRERVRGEGESVVSRYRGMVGSNLSNSTSRAHRFPPLCRSGAMPSADIHASCRLGTNGLYLSSSRICRLMLDRNGIESSSRGIMLYVRIRQCMSSLGTLRKMIPGSRSRRHSMNSASMHVTRKSRSRWMCQHTRCHRLPGTAVRKNSMRAPPTTCIRKPSVCQYR